MKKSIVLWGLVLLISSGIGLISFAQGLGATQLGPGLQNFADCPGSLQGPQRTPHGRPAASQARQIDLAHARGSRHLGR